MDNFERVLSLFGSWVISLVVTIFVGLLGSLMETIFFGSITIILIIITACFTMTHDTKFRSSRIMDKVIYFDENGSEYTGVLRISCKTFEKTGDRTMKVNDAVITLDEDIQSVEDVKLGDSE
jgi:hypothetical protein